MSCRNEQQIKKKKMEKGDDVNIDISNKTREN